MKKPALRAFCSVRRRRRYPSKTQLKRRAHALRRKVLNTLPHIAKSQPLWVGNTYLIGFHPGPFVFTRQSECLTYTHLQIGIIITFENGIIDGFSPRFKSIRKDCDRYFDALADLSEAGAIEAGEVLKYSGPGYLRIYQQYIDHGYLDAVEAHLIKDVTDQNFYGVFFENTRLTLERLMSLSEHELVIRVYKAAIAHRFKALEAEYSISENPKKKSQSRSASIKWVKHYMPPFRHLVSDYAALLTRLEQTDRDIDRYRNLIQTIG